MLRSWPTQALIPSFHIDFLSQLNAEIRIRAATAVDVPAIMAIERQSSNAGHWSEDQYTQMFSENSRRLVLIVESSSTGFIVGFLVAHQVAAEWELENVAVSMDHRRHGIAEKLLRELIATATKMAGTSIFLEVRESNTAARRLYEKIGFRRMGVRKSYYQNALEDAILYRLHLR